MGSGLGEGVLQFEVDSYAPPFIWKFVEHILLIFVNIEKIDVLLQFRIHTMLFKYLCKMHTKKIKCSRRVSDVIVAIAC